MDWQRFAPRRGAPVGTDVDGRCIACELHRRYANSVVSLTMLIGVRSAPGQVVMDWQNARLMDMKVKLATRPERIASFEPVTMQ